MEKFKSKTIAVSKNAMYYLSYATSLRSVKAFLFPYTQIFWGCENGDAFTNRKKSKIYIDIEDFAEIMGYSMSDRITTEIRKIYRKMNQELFEDENSPDIYFSYEGCSKDKKQFILKVHKPKEMFHMIENTAFVCMSADDVFRCENIYDYKILALIASHPLKHDGSCFMMKEIEMNTLYLKYHIMKMDLYKNCYINRKNPKYDKTLLDYIEYYFEEYRTECISYEEYQNELERYAMNNGYKNAKNMMKLFGEIVSFNKRTRIENYMEHALELINQGSMFHIHTDKKTGKLFQKIKQHDGYKVEKYKITVWQKYRV